MADISSLNITEASIHQLQHALSTAALTSVDLVSLFLHRIARYDQRGPLLNSVCVLNPDALKEAQASDDYRASGRKPRRLEGIPFTVKDSYRVTRLTVAAGSPAFADLIASEDAAVVKSLRDAGAVLIGKTNMPPMADGGPQRGLYGTSVGPYNPEYLCTGFASGSSHGSGVSTASSFAPIGLGSETVSSGRAPASNNALVGYSPSRGVIPSRGLWPLYPTCDVVAPHTKSVEDMLSLLDVIANEDSESRGDFWRDQTMVSIPSHQEIRPQDYLGLKDPTSLHGKRIAVPKCYIGKKTSSGYFVAFSKTAQALWLQARADLEALGATIVETDFPLVENYMKQLFPGQSANIPGISEEWTKIERCLMIGMAWDDFLRDNKDEKLRTLSQVDPNKINPGYAPMDDPAQFTEASNQVLYSHMVDSVQGRPASLYDLPGCAEALRALEAARKRDLEGWMDDNGYDLVVFPTNGDVGPADAETTRESMEDALRDGVKYSNGNRAMKHLGVPAITVPMGLLADKQMPVGLTFAGKGWSDNSLLSYAYAYENATKRRTSPPHAPILPTDIVTIGESAPWGDTSLDFTLEQKNVRKSRDEEFEFRHVSLSGAFRSADSSVTLKDIQVFTNEEVSPVVRVQGNSWQWHGVLKRPHVKDLYPIPGKVPRDQFLVVVKAKASNGRSTGLLLLED
ncbi:amidase [Thelonectria olida]|uniref:Amidase n=1 Tax=Thelonectria olida TaxID=1576542 RepID=A0A9P8W0H1_9HYPO|nr:amidase [Thelonectria olida]